MKNNNKDLPPESRKIAELITETLHPPTLRRFKGQPTGMTAHRSGTFLKTDASDETTAKNTNSRVA